MRTQLTLIFLMVLLLIGYLIFFLYVYNGLERDLREGNVATYKEVYTLHTKKN